MSKDIRNRLCAMAGLVIAVASVHAATLHVPADYPTIQSCIDAAVSGQDECVVAPGTYHELINFLGKAITLRSSDGPAITFLDGAGLIGYLLTCNLNETPETRIDGFTIRNGYMENNPGSPTVTNCHFVDSGMDNENSNATIMNCVFFRSGMFNFYGSTTIANCVFLQGGCCGGSGAIRNHSNRTTIENCLFIGNKAIEGGAIYNGNQEHDIQRQLISDCIFIGNSAHRGGAIYNGHGYPTLRNCTFTANSADYGGGAIYVDNSRAYLYDCIFWNDSPQEFDDSYAIISDDIIASFTDIKGGYPSSGPGIIDQDPLFVRAPDPGPDGMWDGIDDDYGDLRLQPGSPCINAGNPAFVPSPGYTDLDSHARVLCGRVDMGAYEFGIGDYDCDQAVNLNDFAAWSACMIGPLGQSPDGCQAFDFDGDADVDLTDFAQFELLMVP